MQKTIQSLIIGSALLGGLACATISNAADNPKPEPVANQAEEVVEVQSGTEALEVPSGNYIMDKIHGYVTFSYLHKGLSRPVLRFNDVDATLVLDAEHPENSQIDVTITAANIDSGVAKLDAHLKSADFFNTAENPKITFKSTGFTRDSETDGTMVGDLTMMGVTKSISFAVSLIGTADGKKPSIGVEGQGRLLRSEFNLGKFVPYVGDEVSISISAEFNKAD
jgi:polyisoprenoid-binding protein YceI